MDFTSLYDSLSLIKPEIVISVTLLLIVIFDLIFHKNKTLIPYIALAGLIIGGIYVLSDISNSGFAFVISSTSNNFGLLALDSFGSYFKFLIIITSILIVFFAKHSLEIKNTGTRQGEFYTLLFGMILGMMFMISASDLIMIYVSMELLSFSSYVLAGFIKLRDRNSEASLKYIIFGGVASGIMLFGISLIYGLTGTTNLYQINQVLQSAHVNLIVLSFSLLLVVAGIGYKISAVPFHFWTPDVYEGAPVSITAFLSVASKAAGFAILIRLIKTAFVSNIDSVGNWQLIPVFDWQTLLAVLAILTMTLGNFAALWQDNLKRMLAYSSIAHAGYLLLGIVVFSEIGIEAVLIYFAVYMLMNLGSFYIVMLIADKTGSENIDDYGGLGYVTPFLGVSFAVFLVSLTGLPPTAGFIGKLYLFIALIDAKMTTLAVIAVLNSVVSLYYYIRVLKHMFLKKPDGNVREIKLSAANIVYIVILLIPVLLLGIYFTPLVNFAESCLAFLHF